MNQQGASNQNTQQTNSAQPQQDPNANGVVPSSYIALQTLLTNLKANTNNPQAQQQIVSILKNNPQLMAAFLKHRQQEQQLQRQQERITASMQQMNLNQSASMQPPQSSSTLHSIPVPNQVDCRSMNQQETPNQIYHQMNLAQSQNPNSNGAVPRTYIALESLLTNMKATNNPQAQQQIVSILKNNPQLMAAFLRQRQQHQQQQRRTDSEQ